MEADVKVAINILRELGQNEIAALIERQAEQIKDMRNCKNCGRYAECVGCANCIPYDYKYWEIESDSVRKWRRGRSEGKRISE